MKITISVILILGLSLSNEAFSEEPEILSRHPEGNALPVYLLIYGTVWGVYKLGGNTKESQRNVKILFASPIVIGLGVLFYVDVVQEKREPYHLNVTSKSDTVNLAFRYRF